MKLLNAIYHSIGKPSRIIIYFHNLNKYKIVLFVKEIVRNVLVPIMKRYFLTCTPVPKMCPYYETYLNYIFHYFSCYFWHEICFYSSRYV